MIEIIDKTKCCGCTACVNICPRNCIDMEEDSEGFLYPCVNKSDCVNCGMCEKVCPILNYEQIVSNPEQEAAIVQHKDTEICRQSTAGGAFTGIAEYVIEQGGVVFGVEMGSDYVVRHIGIDKKEDLYKFRNSKYVQSDVGATFQEVKRYLEDGRMVCFSGTPCQIEGIRRYLKKDYEKLVLVDVVCRAVPSPGVWKKYMNMVVRKCGPIDSVRFRDKSLGYQYSTMELKNVNGKIYRGGIESQPWLRMFFSGMIIRPSCTKCPFRNKFRKSDFTIWDCFNIYNIDKDFDERIGTTRVLIHSKKGKEIFEKVKECFKYRMLSVNTVVEGVQQLHTSPLDNSRREEFFEDLSKMPMEEVINKYFPETKIVRLKKGTRRILNFFGLDRVIKHVLKRG